MVKVKRAILAIAIAILFTLFVAYAIQTFYPSPEYDDFCEPGKIYYIYKNQADCEAAGGKWTTYTESKEPRPVQLENQSQESYCEQDYTCRDEYDAVRAKYNRNIFFITLVLGLLTIIIAVLLQLESVSAGFMAGGVILVIYGTIRYWGDLSDVWRTIMLGFALAVLVWIGYKKLK